MRCGIVCSDDAASTRQAQRGKLNLASGCQASTDGVQQPQRPQAMPDEQRPHPPSGC